MSVDITCNECKSVIDKNKVQSHRMDEIMCKDCYIKLEDKIFELNTKVSQLEDEIYLLNQQATSY